MTEGKGLDFLDFLIVVVKWKFFLLFSAIIIFALSYSAVYYLIPEKFEATTIILPSDGQSMGEFGSLLKNLQGLPLSLGKGGTKSSTDLYAAILFSRTSIDTLIAKFDLKKDFKIPDYDKLVKAVRQDILFDDKDNATVRLTVLATSPKKAADMANHLVRYLNRVIIELNVRKSRDNRLFLEQRYNDIKLNLKGAEDSLLYYQRQSGIIEAENQIKATIEANTSLEKELARQEIELAVAEQVYGASTPQVNNLRIAVDELRSRVAKLKEGTNGNSFLLPVSGIPTKALQYFRYFRDVKIFSSMLEFIIPIYEQAKFEEQKDVPILQVIDNATAPEKKSYPPRSLYALIATLCLTGFIAAFLLIREVFKNSRNEKLLFLRKELFRFSRRSKIDSES